MHRHRGSGRQLGQRPRGALRVEMPVSQEGAPTAHRQQRDVALPDLVGHRVEEPGVAGEVGPRLTGEDEAERRGALRAERQPPSVVRRGHRPYRQLPELPGVPGRHLHEAQPVPQPSQPGHRGERALGQQDRGPRGQSAKRGQVEMVGVQVRDQDHVRLGRDRRRYGAASPAQMCQPPGEQRIGQHPHPRVPHGHRGMAPPRDLHRHRARPFTGPPAPSRHRRHPLPSAGTWRRSPVRPSACPPVRRRPRAYALCSPAQERRGSRGTSGYDRVVR